MKTSTLAAVFSTLLAAATAQGDLTWYDPIHDITCTGHADGHITCQKGQVDAPAQVAPSFSTYLSRY